MRNHFTLTLFFIMIVQNTLEKPTVKSDNALQVTKDNFDLLVKNSKADVFIQFYAPWCERCRKFADNFDELAIMMKNDPSIIIAQIDATVHRIHYIDIKTTPTHLFFKKGSNPQMLTYDGPKELKSVLQFIQENRSASEHKKSKIDREQDL